MKIKSIIFTAVLALASTSCSDWLDVKPSDRISEEGNFSSVPGFCQALNGIYVELNTNQLYGRTLSCEFIEIIAQRYAVSAENKDATELMNHTFDGSVAESRLESIWGKAYNLIANTNLLLRNCEINRQVLPDDYYHVIKGEAYALRAYLHLDLFRLFGHIYQPGAVSTAIPYYDEFALDVAPTLSSAEFMEHVIKDLLIAEQELQDDPIVHYGVNGNPKDVFFCYRNLRLNLYAVQALLARAYYYMQDNDNAYKYASKVINIQEKYFPWVTQIALTRAEPDHMFSTEILFALQNLSRNTIYTGLFDGGSLKAGSLLAPKNDVILQIFEDSKAETDYRFKYNFSTTTEISGTQYRIFTKYQGTDTDSLYTQMIPMLRASEAFLIAVETAPTDQEKLDLFETFRNHRGLQGADNIAELQPTGDLNTLLEKEWIKEFYGEGQLFYWYKRNGYTKMRSATDPTNSSPFYVSSQSSYVLPIPDAETKYN